MTNKQILILLGTILGELDSGWQAASGHDKQGAFTIIRYDSSLKKGALRRCHALIEDLLSEHLGEGDRVE
jgi:hypothetical protein